MPTEVPSSSLLSSGLKDLTMNGMYYRWRVRKLMRDQIRKEGRGKGRGKGRRGKGRKGWAKCEWAMKCKRARWRQTKCRVCMLVASIFRSTLVFKAGTIYVRRAVVQRFASMKSRKGLGENPTGKIMTLPNEDANKMAVVVLIASQGTSAARASSTLIFSPGEQNLSCVFIYFKKSYFSATNEHV